jgi:hypothetical protein
VGKGALATCPPSIIAHASRWWARCRFAHPTGLRTDLLIAQAQLHAAGLRPIGTTGKSLLIFRNRVKPGIEKYSAFVPTQISGTTPLVSRQMRGARDRHERAVGCDGRRRRDRRARRTRTAKSCGSGAAVLALSCVDQFSRSDGGKRAVLREEHEVSRKAIAQGRPECSRCPVAKPITYCAGIDGYRFAPLILRDCTTRRDEDRGPAASKGEAIGRDHSIRAWNPDLRPP